MESFLWLLKCCYQGKRIKISFKYENKNHDNCIALNYLTAYTDNFVFIITVANYFPGSIKQGNWMEILYLYNLLCLCVFVGSSELRIECSVRYLMNLDTSSVMLLESLGVSRSFNNIHPLPGEPTRVNPSLFPDSWLTASITKGF